MANQWFRLWAEFAIDPKVQMMPEINQRRLIMLFCLRCNGQETLLDEQVAFQLRISSAEWIETKADFTERGFLDKDNNVLNWDKRQFLSDSSATRVRKHRDKRMEHGLTAQDWIPKALRAEVFGRDGNACVYCTSTDDLTLDHKTPTARGGSNEEANLQVACRVCNADKRHMTHEEYMSWPGRVTLLKRPQNTDTEQKQKQKRHTANGKPSPECISLYQAYPRHVAPDTAYRAIAKALARKPFAELLAAVTRFATQCRKDATEAQFIPHPATWFNAGRYDDGEVLLGAVRPKTQYELNTEAQLEERRQAIAAAGVVQ